MNFWQDRRGMETVEAAITFPIAILVMLAVVNLGLVVYGQQAVQAAARGKVDQAGLAVKLGGRAALDKMLFLCEKVEEILRSAQFSNLDKKLVFIDAMLEIKRAS